MQPTTDVQAQARPTVVQGSHAPVFKGTGGRDLSCGSCGNVLVKGYEPRCLIAIDIECFGCKSVTRTDHWPRGEPLPVTLVTLGGHGRVLVAGTVDMNGGAAFTCDQEIQRVEGETRVRRPGGVALELSIEGLAAFGAKLNLLTSGAYDECMASTMRAAQAGNSRFLTYPPAWAVQHLQRRIAKDGEIDLDGPDGIALTYVMVLDHLMDRWQHHPLFHLLAKPLLYEFHHSVTQLVIASYLGDHGNPIGWRMQGSPLVAPPTSS